jgi:exodeoxyribonuclease VII small subunit
MSKEANEGARGAENYGDVAKRLDEVVKRLESGDLPLEESLRAFEEGIRLVRKGEQLLGDAEKRIEELLAEDGGEERVVALKPGAPAPEMPRPQAVSPRKQAEPPPQDDDDVPF